MYLAKQNEDYNTSLYISIFKTLQSGQGNSYKEEIDTVLLDVKKIISGEKSINSINNKYFFLTTFLMDKAEDLLRQITPETIDNNIYSKVTSILENRPIYA
jgi:hypothetical protein